jgi:hypothetical protein
MPLRSGKAVDGPQKIEALQKRNRNPHTKMKITPTNPTIKTRMPITVPKGVGSMPG